MPIKIFYFVFALALTFNLSPFFYEIKGRTPASANAGADYSYFSETNPALLIH